MQTEGCMAGVLGGLLFTLITPCNSAKSVHLMCGSHYLTPLQPAKVACIEYPREPGKDEQYAWVCLFKAVWVADAMLGVRAQVRVGRLRASCCLGAGCFVDAMRGFRMLQGLWEA